MILNIKFLTRKSKKIFLQRKKYKKINETSKKTTTKTCKKDKKETVKSISLEISRKRKKNLNAKKE